MLKLCKIQGRPNTNVNKMYIKIIRAFNDQYHHNLLSTKKKNNAKTIKNLKCLRLDQKQITFLSFSVPNTW